MRTFAMYKDHVPYMHSIRALWLLLSDRTLLDYMDKREVSLCHLRFSFVNHLYLMTW